MSENTTTGTTVSTEEIGEIVRIVDPELDVEAILAEIRANLAKRAPLDPDPNAFVYRPGDATAKSGQLEVEWQIEQATEYARSLSVGDQMRVGTGTVSQLAARVKRPLHHLVRYYVDLLAQRQSLLEGHVLGALRALAARSGATDEEIARLRQEVAELRKLIDAQRGAPTDEAPSR